MNCVCIFLGGGIGSMLRYGVSLLTLPMPTLVVNVLGSFLIGLFYGLSARFGWSDSVRLLLTTGLCGGFTTFSTFSNETLQFVKDGNAFAAVGYVVASVVLGLIAVWLGYLATKVSL